MDEREGERERERAWYPSSAVSAIGIHFGGGTTIYYQFLEFRCFRFGRYYWWRVDFCGRVCAEISFAAITLQYYFSISVIYVDQLM